MKIGVIGMGFVGGTTAKVFKRTHKIFPYDKYKKEYCSEKNIKELAKNSEAVLICVPTPMKQSGAIDYSAIYDSLNILIENVKKIRRNPKEIVVIIRSTAVPGTTDKMAKKYPFKFAFNPEFLREKNAIEDMKNTDRVVIGSNEKYTANKVIAIYKPLFPNAKYIIVDRKTAEMIKYAANVFLASQVTLANEIYNVCKSVGIDYGKVKDTILLDERIARNINVPGPDGDFGFGGKCFPKDLNALIYLAKEKKYNPRLLKEIWKSNKRFRNKKDWLDIPGATSANNNFKIKQSKIKDKRKK